MLQIYLDENISKTVKRQRLGSKGPQQEMAESNGHATEIQDGDLVEVSTL